MPDVTLLIDGRSVKVAADATVLEAAKSIEIDIPTLCWLPRFAPAASCLVCAVQIEGTGKLVPSCSTKVLEGMSVLTASPVVAKQRKVALELLLSDHVGDCEAPCLGACPAHLDIPEMNRVLAEGRWDEATKIVFSSIPLPATLGRICARPCESYCRRKPLDGAVAVCSLKRSVGDKELNSEEPHVPDIATPTGNRVAVLGAGPAGIAVAFFLRVRGHSVALYDNRDKLGGALRDIPEDRLPQNILDGEVAILGRMGVETNLGATVALSKIRETADAVVVAVGQSEGLSLGFDKDDLKVVGDFGTTNLPGVFAVGAYVTPYKSAVRATGDGHAVADLVDEFLTGRKAPPGPRFRMETDRDSTDFATTKMVLADPSPRADMDDGLPDEAVSTQAARCLQCGCAKADDCALRTIAGQYGANALQYAGSRRESRIDNTHAEVVFESGKCILCGICVRIAAEHGEQLGIGYQGRGFDTRVAGPFGAPLATALRQCACQCAEACPTGALYLREKADER